MNNSTLTPGLQTSQMKQMLAICLDQFIVVGERVQADAAVFDHVTADFDGRLGD